MTESDVMSFYASAARAYARAIVNRVTGIGVKRYGEETENRIFYKHKGEYVAMYRIARFEGLVPDKSSRYNVLHLCEEYVNDETFQEVDMTAAEILWRCAEILRIVHCV